MENKGLCVTCVSIKGCVFSKRFPVLQCEEFSDYVPAAKAGNSAAKCNKQREARCVELETMESFD